VRGAELGVDLVFRTCVAAPESGAAAALSAAAFALALIARRTRRCARD
jgi:hypothetical protein